MREKKLNYSKAGDSRMREIFKDFSLFMFTAKWSPSTAKIAQLTGRKAFLIIFLQQFIYVRAFRVYEAVKISKRSEKRPCSQKFVRTAEKGTVIRQNFLYSCPPLKYVRNYSNIIWRSRWTRTNQNRLRSNDPADYRRAWAPCVHHLFYYYIWFMLPTLSTRSHGYRQI